MLDFDNFSMRCIRYIRGVPSSLHSDLSNHRCPLLENKLYFFGQRKIQDPMKENGSLFRATRKKLNYGLFSFPLQYEPPYLLFVVPPLMVCLI